MIWCSFHLACLHWLLGCFPVSVKVSVDVDEHGVQEQLGKERVPLIYTCILLFIIERSQNRNSNRVRTEAGTDEEATEGAAYGRHYFIIFHSLSGSFNSIISVCVLYVYACAHSCMYRCTCLWRHVCMLIHLCTGAQVNVKCCLPLLSILLFENRSLTNPGTHCFNQVV